MLCRSQNVTANVIVKRRERIFQIFKTAVKLKDKADLYNFQWTSWIACVLIL